MKGGKAGGKAGGGKGAVAGKGVKGAVKGAAKGTVKGGKGAKGKGGKGMWNPNPTGAPGYQGTCWRCGKIGHKAPECYAMEVDVLEYWQGNGGGYQEPEEECMVLRAVVPMG